MMRHEVMEDKQLGFSLMEILVTLVVVVIGILGLISMQMVSSKNANNAFYRQQATFLAEDILDRARANPTETYTITKGNMGSSCTVSCNPASLKGNDIKEWKDAIAAAQLPGGEGEVTYDPVSRVYTVTITWTNLDKQDGSGNSLTGGGNGSLTMKSVK